MKSVAILCFVGVFFCLLNGAFGQLRGACPLATPVRCSNGTCVTSSALCNTNPCGGATPYLCSNGSCAISAFYCNCPGVICFDGSCKTTIDQCPILQGCPEDLPQRCPDGSCDVFNSTCTGKQGPTCPTGLTKCVDGICRSIDLCNALPYYGCPKFQCPRGICATTWTTCECSPGVVLCYDGTCTPVGPGGWPNCTVTAPAFVSPQNLTTTVSTSSSSSTSVGTTSSSSTTVLTVTLPANSTSGTLALRKRDAAPSIDTVQIDGCSSPLWAGRTAIDDAGNQYDATMSSPIVTASFGTGQTTLNPGTQATLQFENVYLEPNGTYCVAGLNEVTQRWECLSNTVITPYSKRTSSQYGSVSGTTTEFGKKFGVLKTQVYQCTPTCPEQQCADEIYDLKTADGLITVGTLSVNNKDDIEIQFEINLYEDRTNSNYGWKLAGILVEVGEKLLQIDYSTHSDKYREYTTVQFSDAFPNGGSQCGLNVPFLFVGSVLDDGPCPSKRTEPTCTPINRVVYAYPRNKRTSGPSAPYPSNPSAFTQTYPMCCTCRYRSELISNWGRTCAVTPVGCYRDSRFAIAYPRGMVVGCPTGNTITFTNAASVASFLDNRDTQFGSPAALTQSYTNPATTEAKSLAGYITSVSLSDRMDRLDKNWADSCNWLRGVYACGGTCGSNFAGKKISEILDIANGVLGGCRSDYSPSAIVSCLDDIERSFDGGRRVDSFSPRGYSVTPCN